MSRPKSHPAQGNKFMFINKDYLILILKITSNYAGWFCVWFYSIYFFLPFPSLLFTYFPIMFETLNLNLILTLENIKTKIQFELKPTVTDTLPVFNTISVPQIQVWTFNIFISLFSFLCLYREAQRGHVRKVAANKAQYGRSYSKLQAIKDRIKTERKGTLNPAAMDP